jgi:hypothetical protein
LKRDFWHVQPTGDYDADCQTGGQFAIEYLRYLQTDSGPVLMWIPLTIDTQLGDMVLSS